MFYTSAESVGNRIFHKYVKEGKRYQEVVKEFPIELYVKGKSPQNVAKSIYGDRLNRIDFGDIESANEFIRNYKDVQDIYGHTGLLYQFLSYTYPDNIEHSFSDVVIVSIDIETAYTDAGFPTPDIAAQEILSIAIKVFGKESPVTVFRM